MQKEKQPTFVIRKLTIGAASVLVGLSFFGANNKIVKADTINNSNDQTSAVTNQNTQTPSQNNQDSSDVVQTTKTNHTQINYQDQNGNAIAPSKNINTEYQGYYKKTQGQVIYHDDTTNQDIAKSQVTGYVGQKPDLTKFYTNKGYDVVSSNQNRLSQNSQDNNYTVHLKHHIDSQVTSSQKATNTINYVDSQNKQLQNSTVQTHNFETRTNTDRVTGTVTTQNPEASYTFKGQNNPVIDGYITKNKTSQDVTVTPNDLNKQENVVYSQLGKFIMIDTDNNIIGDQTYLNDNANASSVINLAPTISGYKLTTKFDQILDPTQNTTLVYQKINQTNPSNPDNPSPSDNPNKDHDNPVNPDNPNTNPNNPNKDNNTSSNPDKPDNPNKPANPDNPNTNPNNPNKDSNKPSNPDNPNEPDTNKPTNPDQSDNPNKPNTPDQNTDHVAKPGDTVKPFVPDPNKQDNTKDGVVSLVLNAVDEQNHILLNPDTNKPYTVEEDHKLADNENDYNFNLISSPVVPGYITDMASDEDIVVTRKMGTYTINRVYKKLAHYLFKDKDGNTIKDPMVYANSDNPTDCSPLDEAPTIDGYKLEDGQSPVIVNPYKDTTLIYDKMPDSQIILKYYDDDDDKEIGQETLTGKLNSISDAVSRMQLAAAKYEDQGYVLQDSDLEYDPIFTEENQTFTTHFKHNTKRSLKEKRYTHRTIHFIDKLTGKPMQADAVQTAEWKKYQVTDAVTGVTKSENQWQVNTDESKYQHYGDEEYESFKVPFYDGWHTDESVVPNNDLPDTPDDPDANQEITISYTQNGHFKIHMLKAKQTVVGYDTYTDENGQTHTVRDYAKDRYELVEDTSNPLNKQNVTFNSDKQAYQTIAGDVAVPGESDTDEKADGQDSPQRKTDGKNIKKTHKLNEGLPLIDLLPKNKKYVLHSEEYQGRIVPKKYFTAYKLDVVKGEDGKLHEQNGDAYTTGWPYRHHSEGESSEGGRLMDGIYAPQNLDVYYRPYAINGHKVYKNGDVGENGEYGKITNFAVKKYNPASYAGMDKRWATDNSPKLKWPLVAKDGSWSDPDEGKDNEISNEDENADFTDKDNEIPLNQNVTSDDQDQGDPDDANPNQPDSGSLDNDKDAIDTSRPDYHPSENPDDDILNGGDPDKDLNDDNDNNEESSDDISLDSPSNFDDIDGTSHKIHVNNQGMPVHNATSKNTETQKVHAAMAMAQESVNINQPIMFYKVLVNGQEVARDLTKDQLENYAISIASPIINNKTPDQASIKLSYHDPANQTIIVKYTTNKDNTKPDHGDTNNPSQPAKPNDSNKNSSSTSDQPTKPNDSDKNNNNSSNPSQPANPDNSNKDQDTHKSDIPQDLSKADYNIYTPTVKDLTLTQDSAVPDAKTVITNSNQMPDGTLYAWNTKPNTSTIKSAQAYVTVLFPDNTSNTLPVAYTVISNTKPVTVYDNQKYTPIAKRVTLKQGQTAPEAKDFIENINDLPTGTICTWVKTPYTNIPAGYPGVADMQIIYPDNSKDSLAIIYSVISNSNNNSGSTKPSGSNNQANPVNPDANPNTPNTGDTDTPDQPNNPVNPNNPVKPNNNQPAIDPKNPNKGITDSGQVIKPNDKKNNSTIIGHDQNSSTNNSQINNPNNSGSVTNPQNNVRHNQNTNINSQDKPGETPSNTNIHKTYQQGGKVINKADNKLDLTNKINKTNNFKRSRQKTISGIKNAVNNNSARPTQNNSVQSSLKAFNARIYASQAVPVQAGALNTEANSVNNTNTPVFTSNRASNTQNSPVAMTMPIAQVKLTRAENSVNSNTQSMNQNSTLPQTGRANYNLAIPAIGLAILINAELFGLIKPRRKYSN